MLMMFNRNNKNNKQTKPLFQMKTSYDKVAKVMTEPPKDYNTIKNLIEDKQENILDLNITKDSKIKYKFNNKFFFSKKKP